MLIEVAVGASRSFGPAQQSDSVNTKLFVGKVLNRLL